MVNLNPHYFRVTPKAKFELLSRTKYFNHGPLNTLQKIPILLFSYGTIVEQQDGSDKLLDEANYSLGLIATSKLINEIIIEIDSEKFIAIRPELPLIANQLHWLDLIDNKFFIFSS